jgi:hypothetical protein
LEAGTIGAQSPKIDGDDSQWDNQHVNFGKIQEVLVNLLSMLAKSRVQHPQKESEAVPYEYPIGLRCPLVHRRSVKTSSSVPAIICNCGFGCGASKSRHLSGSGVICGYFSVLDQWALDNKPRVASNEPIVPIINVRADDYHCNVD